MDEELAPPPVEFSWRQAPVLLADRLGVTPAGVVVGLIAVIGAVAGAWFALRPPPVPTEQVLPMVAATPVLGAEPTATVPSLVVVHVDGAVARPGVHELDAGSRVVDAVAAAGGLTADADRARLNLALVVSDQQRIWVPVVGEQEPDLVMPAGAEHGAGESDGPTGRIDLNRATPSQLEALPGIGPSLATAIVGHREREGPFATVEQLLDVTGIGPAKLDQIRALVAV